MRAVRVSQCACLALHFRFVFGLLCCFTCLARVCPRCDRISFEVPISVGIEAIQAGFVEPPSFFLVRVNRFSIVDLRIAFPNRGCQLYTFCVCCTLPTHCRRQGKLAAACGRYRSGPTTSSWRPSVHGSDRISAQPNSLPNTASGGVPEPAATPSRSGSAVATDALGP